MLKLEDLKILLIIMIGLVCSLIVLTEPKIVLNGNKIKKIPIGSIYKEEGAIISYPFQKIRKKIKITDNIDYNHLGQYYVNYEFSYQGKKYKTVRKIEIIDKTKPTINLVGENTVSVCPNKTYQEEGYEAIDNYDGNISNKVERVEEKEKIKYIVSDSSHNETYLERNIIYEDKEAPQINLKGDSTVYVTIGTEYKELGYEVIDNCSDNLQDKVEIINPININKTGNYQIIYKVKDEAGLESTAIRNVVVKENQNNGKVIYLTFDDGPSASITPSVLQILKEEGVQATFFVINHSDQLDYLLKQESDEGHTVAIHSYTHNYRLIYSSVDSYFDDLQKMGDKIYRITGKRPNVIRFPGGSSNTVSKFNPGIMSTLTKEVMNRGYIYFDWNVGSGDAGDVRSSTAVYQNVTRGLGSYTNVVLMHDFEGNYYTLNALRDIIRYGKEHGYTFSKIDENTPQIKHRIAN